jgi:type VI secretion system protein ImpL
MLASAQSPSWIEFARYYLKLFDQVRSTSPLRGAMNTVTAVNSTAGQALRDSVGQRTNLVSGQIAKARDDMTLVEQYLNGLREASVEVMRSMNSSFDMTDQYFSNSKTTENSTAMLSRIEQDFQAFKTNSRFKSTDDAVIWNVLEGSIDTIRQYAFEQASCKLQQDWEKSVMWKTQLAVNPQEASAQLFGNQGSVWGFVDGPAKSFVTRKGGFISPVEVSGKQFPFAPGFVAFLNQAVSSRVNEVVKEKLAQSSVTKGAKISIAASPIGVNRGAKARPFAAMLTIQCTQETIELSNLNFQASNTFEWKPDQCGEVILDIQVDNLTLTKRYPGALGLAMFLDEFKDGARIFTPADFPASMQRLDELGIREISLSYEFQGRDDVLKLARDYEHILDQTTPSTRPVLSRLNIEVPARVGRCWTTRAESPAPLTLPRFIQQQAEVKANPPPKPPQEPSPPPKPLQDGTVKTITVAAGETLFSIGKRYRVDPLTLQSMNKLKTDKILTGQKLLVPIWAETGK